MRRIAILTLEEGARLQWCRLEREYYNATGDWGFYLLPPCIILPGLKSIDGDIDIGNGIFIPERKAAMHDGWSMLPINDERLHKLSGNPGLFLSCSQQPADYIFPEETIKIKGIALAETDGTSSRIIRFRPLKRDR